MFPKQQELVLAESVDASYLDMLKTSLENEDYGTADFVCGEIQKYQYSDEIQALTEKLAGQIFNLESEEALETIEVIRAAGK